MQVQNPITLGRYSEPQPDIALLRPRADFYKSAHPRPADIFLVAEVADTTLEYDRRVKVPLYAGSGVSEVWLIDLSNRTLTRYRNPWDGGYAQTDQPDLAAAVQIGQLDGVAVVLDGVMAR